MSRSEDVDGSGVARRAGLALESSGSGSLPVAVLPRAPRTAFPVSKAELDEIRQRCRNLVLRSAGLSGVAAVVPVPAADIGVDISLFLNLLPAINAKFGLAAEQVAELDPRTKELIFVSVTSVGSQAVAKIVTAELVLNLLKRIGVRVTLKSVAKWVPFIGQAAAATISFGAMRLVGNRHVEDCYNVALRVLEERERVVEVQRSSFGALQG